MLLIVSGINNCNAQKSSLSKFIPKGYTVYDSIYGDLNNDNSEDCIIIIKGIDKNNIINDKYRGELDRNRRGILVLFGSENNYELAAKNFNCFSSENEDGGVYFPPDLLVHIEKGNLYIKYLHGRYGRWKYTFRYQNFDFELIGYDRSRNSGPIINEQISVNFLTKKKFIKENINKNAEGGDEIFSEFWENINILQLIKLSEIDDFHELYIKMLAY